MLKIVIFILLWYERWDKLVLFCQKKKLFWRLYKRIQWFSWSCRTFQNILVFTTRPVVRSCSYWLWCLEPPGMVHTSARTNSRPIAACFVRTRPCGIRSHLRSCRTSVPSARSRFLPRRFREWTNPSACPPHPHACHGKVILDSTL